MITKHITVDQISVGQDNIIHARTATVVEEDGVELSRSYHRHTLTPGDDLTNEDPRVVAIAAAIWPANQN